ncbi:MAG: nitroreductase family protein [Candidatus Magnetomorum sp.]|nr:nitroreductase family protein [Candidatus Magnetomorum sp.]
MNHFEKSVQDVIAARSSCRSYIEDPIPIEKQNKINDFFKDHITGPFHSTARFILVSATKDDTDALKNLGTYGFIKGASGFIIGAVDKHSEKNMEDYGYVMEKIILLATDLELGTCWIGGSFNKSSFAQKMDIKDNEMLPAVAAIGNKREKRTAVDSIIRWAAGSKNRQPGEHLFFSDTLETPLTQKMAGDYALPLEMVRLGPSASNKQPWRIVKDNNQPIFHFYLQRSKSYSRNFKLLKWADLQRIDMGIAMCHFELSANEIGLNGRWHVADPELSNVPEDIEYSVTWIGQDHANR